MRSWRSVVMGVVLVGASCVLGGVAVAGPPTVPGCVGESVSSAAQAMGSGVGEFVSNTARLNERGVGDAVQAKIARRFSDSAYDLWFIDYTKDVVGIDPSTLTGTEMPRLVFSWTAPQDSS
jgi:hypothetical protein